MIRENRKQQKTREREKKKEIQRINSGSYFLLFNVTGKMKKEAGKRKIGKKKRNSFPQIFFLFFFLLFCLVNSLFSVIIVIADADFDDDDAADNDYADAADADADDDDDETLRHLCEFNFFAFFFALFRLLHASIPLTRL